MAKPARRVREENVRPRQVTQAFKVLIGQAGKAPNPVQEPPVGLSNGLEAGVDLMTLVQLPAVRLEETVRFYVDVLGLPLEYPERPIERNTFVQTSPRIGPGLHILETPVSEFRHLHGLVNGRLKAYFAFYVKNLAQLHERLLLAEAKMMNEPSGGYMSFFDPEGHLIEACERTDSVINDRFVSNITGFRHVRMHVQDPERAAEFFERALGFQRAASEDGTISLKVGSDEWNQPLIRLVKAVDPANPQPMHWMLDGRPKHALELHSKNIGALAQIVIENGGTVMENLEFTGCGGYLKFYTPDGHYIWVNQDRKYCDY